MERDEAIRSVLDAVSNWPDEDLTELAKFVGSVTACEADNPFESAVTATFLRQLFPLLPQSTWSEVLARLDIGYAWLG